MINGERLRRFFLAKLGFVLLLACNTKNDEIVISGDIKNLPDGKIFLTDAQSREVILDSSDIINGRFEIRRPNNEKYVPGVVSLYYITGKSKTEKIPLIINTYSALKDPKEKSSFETAFFLETGITSFSGDIKSKEKVLVSAGRETKLMYRFKNNFGFISTKDTLNKAATLSYYAEVIKQNSGSFFLASSLATNSVQYSKNDISRLFALFDNEVQKSVPGSKIRAYISKTIDDEDPLPNHRLKDIDNQFSSTLDSSSDINLIVFWASWCGPCRREIPYLRKLNLLYGKKGLTIKSISIDEDVAKWKEAVNLEKMPWPQLIADPQIVGELKSVYRFSAIPYMVLTDSKGYKLESFIGYDGSNSQLKLDSLIQKNLK